MRTLAALSIATLLLAGCYIGVGINRAGPAYEEAGKISNIGILPAKLPSEIQGVLTPAEEQRLRDDLPSDAAEWLASGITAETDSAVWAHTISSKPSTGYYMTVDITYLDVGDKKLANETGQDEGQSRTALKGYIYNAASGELVAELHLDKSSSFLGDPPHKLDIEAIARDMGKWFKDKRD